MKLAVTPSQKEREFQFRAILSLDSKFKHSGLESTCLTGIRPLILSTGETGVKPTYKGFIRNKVSSERGVEVFRQCQIKSDMKHQHQNKMIIFKTFTQC